MRKYLILTGKLLKSGLGDMTASGNSKKKKRRLSGAAVWLTEPGAAERMERIIAVSEEIPLASDKDFNQFYMDSMFFEV